MDTSFVIVTGLTCSASEGVINGLLAVGVDVVLIGGRTCGKPYDCIARRR
jgi:carboxyl-terminal processing protease